MKGFESIQAWIDGKTLVQRYFGDEYKYNNEKELVRKEIGDKDWKLCMIPYNELLNMEFDIVIEYPLSFENALKQMCNGETIESEVTKTKYKLQQGVIFQNRPLDEDFKRTSGFWTYEQDSMWKVVSGETQEVTAFEIGSTSYITINGVTKTARTWCKLKGMSFSTYYQRLLRGWSVEKAITTPIRSKR